MFLLNRQTELRIDVEIGKQPGIIMLAALSYIKNLNCRYFQNEETMRLMKIISYKSQCKMHNNFMTILMFVVWCLCIRAPDIIEIELHFFLLYCIVYAVGIFIHIFMIDSSMKSTRIFLNYEFVILCNL